jgi:O-antigen ligase
MSAGVLPGRSNRFGGRGIAAVLSAVALCVLLDIGLLAWIRIGPPGGKGQIFFLELVVMVAAALVVAATAVIAPETARRIAPFLFIALAWHTGFQIPLDSTGAFVITVFDVLVPLCLFLGLVGRWYVTGSQVKTWFQLHWKLFAVFWGFCFWGLVVAMVREVSPFPLLANLKSFVFYPLIIIILPWCIREWRQLYLAVGLMLLLIFERTLVGLDQAATHQVSKFMTELVRGHIIYRIDGQMAATNQYAAYLATGALVLVAIVAASQLRRSIRAALLIPLALSALALLLTYSRGAWLGTGVALVAMLLMLKPRRAAVVLAILAFVAFIVDVIHPDAGTLVLLRANDFDQSITARVNFERTGYQVIQHFPLGAGWGAWFQLVPNGIQAISGYPWYHDDYLQLATEIGIPGLISMLAILGSIVLTGWREARRCIDPNKAALVAGLTSALIGLLVQTGTDQFLWHADIAPHIWIVAGLMLSAAMLIQTDNRKRALIAEALGVADASSHPEFVAVRPR